MTNMNPVTQTSNALLHTANITRKEPTQCQYPQSSAHEWRPLKNLIQEGTDVWIHPNDYRANDSNKSSINYLV